MDEFEGTHLLTIQEKHRGPKYARHWDTALVPLHYAKLYEPRLQHVPWKRIQLPKALPTPIRGAIRIKSSTSSDNPVAGQEFSIFVTVQNPFEVPIVLRRVSTYLPTEFLDVDMVQREIQIEELQAGLAELQSIAQQAGIDTSSLPVPKQRSKWQRYLGTIGKISFGLSGVSIDFSRNPATIARDMQSTQTAELVASVGVPFLRKISGTVRTELASIENRKARNERVQRELQRYQNAISLLSASNDIPRTLHPGNSTTRVFTVRSKSTVWFRPSTYKLNIEIEYEIESVRQIDTIEETISVRASLVSIVLGALVGGIAGWAVGRSPVFTLDVLGLGSLAISLLSAAMSVILLARKKDIQPLVSVEDFWGGIATGFIVALAGPRLVAALVRG